MHQILALILILIVCPFIDAGRECLVEECHNNYRVNMARADLNDPESSSAYCEILGPYKKCLEATSSPCRGNLNYHSARNIMKRLDDDYCRHLSKTNSTKNTKNELQPNTSTSTFTYMLPSCRYYGNNKFRHCGFFGNSHLKTFDAKYQTCQEHGQWNLIENPYMSVIVTNKVDDESASTVTKIGVVIKSRSTPCTLEKRYEADSKNALPSTFVDGTDRPGADETVSLKWKEIKEDHETVEIFMKYIASKLIIRRLGEYLTISARLPEEVIRSSISYEKEGKTELCTAGCPSEELLNLQSARRNVVAREQALNECKNMDKLDYDFKYNLTGSYLDWCLFDLMNNGLSNDFVTVAYLAQLDALSMDPSSLQNLTQSFDWSQNVTVGQTNGGYWLVASARILILQLLFCSIISSGWWIST